MSGCRAAAVGTAVVAICSAWGCLAPPPAPVARAKVAQEPAGQGTLIVNTMNGPMGRFRVDGGAMLIAGPPRRQTLGAGEHRIEVFSAEGALEWEGTLSVGAQEDLVLCWDLREHARCRN